LKEASSVTILTQQVPCISSGGRSAHGVSGYARGSSHDRYSYTSITISITTMTQQTRRGGWKWCSSLLLLYSPFAVSPGCWIPSRGEGLSLRAGLEFGRIWALFGVFPSTISYWCFWGGGRKTPILDPICTFRINQALLRGAGNPGILGPPTGKPGKVQQNWGCVSVPTPNTTAR